MVDNGAILELGERRRRPSYRDRQDPPERVYAIGDVHGRYDLFRTITRLIALDHAKRPDVPTRIIVLGDIIDRGPDAAKMVRGCMRLTSASDRFTVLRGNHEEMMVEALHGDLYLYEKWLTFGGKQTLLSFGVPEDIVDGPVSRRNLRMAARVVGIDAIRWMANLPLYCQHGEYIYVHAGIRPGSSLHKQNAEDLLWITDEFLEDETDHGFTVIHGHTINEDGPDIRSNRIGIDTGAYRTDMLTALGMEAGNIWTLNTISGGSPDPRTVDIFVQTTERQNIAATGERL